MGGIRTPRPNFPGNPPVAEMAGKFPGDMHAESGFPRNPHGIYRGFTGKSAAASNFPGNPPGSAFPGKFPTSRRIPRRIPRAAGFPGKLVALDSGGLPWVLIPINPGISARRLRDGGPKPQAVARLVAIPANPRAGAGISGIVCRGPISNSNRI